jgi:ubiquinone/menaquinone biosynthesis C-methylase UbiE
MRQGARLASLTEHFLSEAGVRAGARVLDVGSGLGDVALSISRIVGDEGEVVGIERDTRSIDFARTRLAERGASNVRFVQADVATYETNERFDAVVGRFVLTFVDDPVRALRRLSSLLVAGGVLGFQEPSWEPALAYSAKRPLFHACTLLAKKTLLEMGASVEMGADLYASFVKAGLPAPRMRCDVEVGDSPDLAQWSYELLASALALSGAHPAGIANLGDLETLPQRLYDEARAARTFSCGIAIFSAWSHPSA